MHNDLEKVNITSSSSDFKWNGEHDGYKMALISTIGATASYAEKDTPAKKFVVKKSE